MLILKLGKGAYEVSLGRYIPKAMAPVVIYSARREHVRRRCQTKALGGPTLLDSAKSWLAIGDLRRDRFAVLTSQTPSTM